MDHLPPLRLLVTFDTVCRLRSMQEAAVALNVTPPAITQAIRALEDQIGVTLLDRSMKPARPTAAGERLAQATSLGLGRIADTIAEIRLSAGLTGLHVTVCCTIGMATYWLMPRLPGFYASFPDIAVNVQAPPSDLPMLAPGIDIALRYGRGGWQDGTTAKLFDECACPVGRPQLIARLAADPAGLAAAPLIHVRSPSAAHWAGWPEYLEHRGLGRPRGQAQFFDNYIQAVQAALDGRGVMLGWRSITQRLVEDGTLAEWPGGSCDFGTAYHVTCAQGSLQRPAARSFLNWIAPATADDSSALSLT